MTTERTSWIEKLNDDPRPIYVIIIILLLPAIFYNLSLTPLIADEGIRGLVALEMIQTGDYLSPTLGGVFYQNKPPLYNWFIMAIYEITGQTNEFSIRLTMTIFLMGFMLAIYFLTRKEVGNKVAAIAAFSFFTCARVLTYDSLYGLIDICFSAITFVIFMMIYRLGKQEKYHQLFFVAYLLTSATFLLKGLPAIAFVGISLIAYFLYQRKWKMLFSWSHILAGLSCLAIIGTYYWLYFQRNPDRTFDDVFLTLLSESSQRTAVEQSWVNTFVHLFQFPLEYIYSFLPWTFLVIYLFRKKALQFIRSHQFLMTCVVFFFANIILYWLSPKSHPRYLFMFFPLSSLVLIYLHEHLKSLGSKWPVLIEYVLMVILALISIGSLSIPFLKETRSLAYVYPLSAFVFIALAVTTWLYWSVRSQRLILLVLFLIVARIGFNAFVLPARYQSNKVVPRVMAAKELGRLSKDKDLYIYAEPIRKYLHGEQVLNARTLFYLTAEHKKQIQHSHDPKPGDWFIIEEGKPLSVPADTVFMLPSYRWIFPVMEIKRSAR